MNEKTTVFAICVEGIKHLLLYNLRDIHLNAINSTK